MTQFAVDPNTGRLSMGGQVMDRYDPRLWGTTGRNITDMSLDQTSNRAEAERLYGDPRYYESYTAFDGDAGEYTRYRLRPEIEQELGGRVQLVQSGQGGYSEFIDPSQLTYDDRFGVLTDPSNIREQDPGRGGLTGFMAHYGIPAATIAAMGWGAGNAAGLWGAPTGVTPTVGTEAGVGAGVGAEAGVGAGAGTASGAAAPGGSLGGYFAGPYAPGQTLAGAVDNFLINNGMANIAASGVTGLLPGGGMDWGDIVRAGLNLYGSRRQPSMQGAAADDRAYNEQMWRQMLQANRPNQNTPFMSSQWSQDPTTGAWTQTQSLNPQDQQRLDMFRGIANQRMQDASRLITPDWNAINPRVGQMIASLGGRYLGGK